MKKLDHENVMNMYDVIDDTSVNKLYMVMDFCRQARHAATPLFVHSRAAFIVRAVCDVGQSAPFGIRIRLGEARLSWRRALGCAVPAHLALSTSCIPHDCLTHA
eukprot:219473-Prymnesium_polylepis.1